MVSGEKSGGVLKKGMCKKKCQLLFKYQCCGELLKSYLLVPEQSPEQPPVQLPEQLPEQPPVQLPEHISINTPQPAWGSITL